MSRTQSSTQKIVRTSVRRHGWKAVWDNHIHLRVERAGMLVHVEWTRVGSVRHAHLATRKSEHVAYVSKVTDKRDKLNTVLSWLQEEVVA